MFSIFRYAPILIVILLWEAATRLHLISTAILPPASTVAAAFWDMAIDGPLLSNAARSLSRAAAGLFAAVAVGITLGILMAAVPLLRAILNPIVKVFYPLPKTALIPVLMVWLGLGDMSKIALIFLGCLLPVIITAYNGARGVNHVILWSAASLGASRWQILREVVLPAAMPDILAGMRIALAFAFILMVSAELVIAKDGIGLMITLLGNGGAYPQMFAAILTVAVVGFVADRLFGIFERRTLRWRGS